MINRKVIFEKKLSRHLTFVPVFYTVFAKPKQGVTMSEKREYPRLNCNVKAAMISNGYFFHDTLLNLSEDGAQIEIKSPVKVGRDVLLSAYIGSKRLKVLADIKWRDISRRRLGVQFLYLPVALRQHIRDMSSKIT